MKKLFLIFLALPLFGQTTYTSSKYKPVWYSSTYEKTHGTYALFDTSSIKLQWTTSGKPEMKFFGPAGNTLFYLDSTGTISTGTTSGGLLKADFDDSLNNAHTITGLWKFGANVAVNSGYSFISKDADSDTLAINVSGFSTTNTKAAGPVAFQLKDGATSLMLVDTLGYTGIGTVTPLTYLHVYKGSDPGTSGLGIFETVASGANTRNIILKNSGTANNTQAQLEFHTLDAGSNIARLALINGNMSDNTATTPDGKLIFQTLTDGALSSVMTLYSRKAGIGTEDPQHLLSIVGGTPITNIVDSDINKLRNTAAQATDSSSLKLDASTTFPTIQFSGGDGDQYTISGNTSDQAVFAGASGGYTFDSYGSFTGGVVINNTAVAPTAISGRMYFQGINNADADTLLFYNGTAWKQFISL
jgi:hypothetical protein